MSVYLQSPRGAIGRARSASALPDAELKRQQAIERRQKRDELARKIAAAQPLRPRGSR